jgi:hypothetical protein
MQMSKKLAQETKKPALYISRFLLKRLKVLEEAIRQPRLHAILN